VRKTPEQLAIMRKAGRVVAGVGVQRHPQVRDREQQEPGCADQVGLGRLLRHAEMGRRRHEHHTDEGVHRRRAARLDPAEQGEAVAEQHRADEEQADGRHGERR